MGDAKFSNHKIQRIEGRDKCNRHKLTMTSYCETCKDFVCNKCKQENHKDHQIVPINSKINELKEELDRYADELREDRIPNLQKHLHETVWKKQQIEENCRTLLNEIIHRRKCLTRKVESEAKSLLNHIESHQSKYVRDLDSNISKMEERLKYALALLSKCEEMVKGQSRALLEFCMRKPEVDQFQTTKCTSASKRVPSLEFVVNDSETQLLDLVGVLRPLKQIRIEVLKFISFDVYIENFFVKDDYSVWLSRFGYFVLLSGGYMHQKIKETRREVCPAVPSSFVVNSFDEILFAVTQDNSVYKITKSSTKCLLQLHPFIPTGLCLTEDGDLLVCMYNNVHGKVQRYPSGNFGISYEIGVCYRENEPLLKKPVKIVQNSNRDICLIDWIYMKVIVLKDTGLLNFEFRSKRKNFEPLGICTDSRMNILVSDYSNKFIDILRHDGHLMTSVPLDKFGIGRPMGLCSTKDGILWIGQGNGKVHIIRYLQ